MKSSRPTPHPPRDSSPPGSSRRLRDARGFTIIEVTMATFVMAFSIATSIIALQMGFKSIDVARDSTLAAQIMQSEIERLRLLPWSKTTVPEVVDSIAEFPLDTAETVSLSTMFTSSAAMIAKYEVTRTVRADSTRASEVRHITLQVRWNSYDGRRHTRSFTTMYAKNGLYDYYYTLANPSP